MQSYEPHDKVKVARMVGQLLNVTDFESMPPNDVVNHGLRSLHGKQLSPQFLNTVQKIVNLATSVGIDVVRDSLPPNVSHPTFTNDVIGSTMVEPKDRFLGSNHIRHAKIRHRTETTTA